MSPSSETGDVIEPRRPMQAPAPVVTIGMPVFNEEAFVGDALRSLLDQDFSAIELLVSDNASTDRTGEICRAVAAADPRVTYVRNETNIGAAANFNRVLEMARGRYFMWAGGHDLWDRALVARAVRVLDERPEAVLAGAACLWIGPGGEPLPRHSGWTDTSGMSAVERMFTVLWGNMHPILGLMRTNALRATRGVRDCAGADLVLLCDLALGGDFVFVPDTCWYRREVRPPESYSDMMARYRSRQYALVRGSGAGWPLLSLAASLVEVAWRSRLPRSSRLAMCAALLASMPVRYAGARLRRQ